MKVTLNEMRNLIHEVLDELVGFEGFDTASADPLAGINPATGAVDSSSGRASPGRTVRAPDARQAGGAPATPSSTGRETNLGGGSARGENARQRAQAIRQGWYDRDGRTLTQSGRREISRRAAAFLNQFRGGRNPDPSGLLAGGQGRAYDLDHMAYRIAARRWNLERAGMARQQAPSQSSGQGLFPTTTLDSWIGQQAAAGAARVPMASASGPRRLSGYQAYPMNENKLRNLIRTLVQEQMGNLPPRRPGASRLPPVPTEPRRDRGPQQPNVPPVPGTPQAAKEDELPAEAAITEMVRKIVRQTLHKK